MRLDEAQLTAYLDGELGQAEREWVEKQLAASPRLQALLAQLRREIGQVDRALDLLAPGATDQAPARLALRRPQAQPASGSGSLVWESSPLFSEIKAALGGRNLVRGFLMPASLIAAVVALAVMIGVGAGVWRSVWLPQPAVQTPGPVGITPGPQATASSRILFTIPDEFAGSKGRIFTIGPNGEGTAQVGTFQSENEQPTLSPDGHKIALPLAEGDILVMNSDGSNPVNITNTPDTAESSPAWSPDSRQLAFVEGRGQGLGVMDADGTRRARLTDDKPAYYSYPAWSPDGQRLAFISNRDGDWDLYVMNADGTNLLNLTRDASGEAFFTWSPDGQRLAYINREGMYVIGGDGGNRTLLPFDYPDYFDPRTLAWSPDGRRLAFLATRVASEQLALFTVQPDGTALSRLTSPAMWVGPWFAWSPDGQKLAFSAGSKFDQSSLYVMDADGAQPTRLTGDDSQLIGLIEWRAVSHVATAATPRPPAATPAPPATFTATRAPTPTPHGDTPASAGPAVTVNTSLNVRSGPGAAYDRVGSLASGTTVAIVGRTADSAWWQIPYDGAPGGKGWISAGYGEARNTDGVPVVEAPPAPTPKPATATPSPATPAAPTPAVQFQPKGSYAGANAGLTRFKGTITDRDGNPVNGFSLYFSCGGFHVMSFPSGPSSVAPNWAPGWYDQYIDSKELECDWTMQVVMYKCSNWFDPQCTQFDALAPPDYFHTKPGQTVVTADWQCNFDCDKGIKR